LKYHLLSSALFRYHLARGGVNVHMISDLFESITIFQESSPKCFNLFAPLSFLPGIHWLESIVPPSVLNRGTSWISFWFTQWSLHVTTNPSFSINTCPYWFFPGDTRTYTLFDTCLIVLLGDVSLVTEKNEDPVHRKKGWNLIT